jgi:hypothetical protein
MAFEIGRRCAKHDRLGAKTAGSQPRCVGDMADPDGEIHLLCQKIYFLALGTVDDAVGAALFLLDNGNMNGSTLYSDGGYTMR